MGCFLACFGFSSKKKKRRKPPKTVLIGDKVSYEPLDCYVCVNLDVPENRSFADPSTPPPPSNKQLNVKIKKKVRFDLNVRAYEPIPIVEISPHLSESDEEENKGKGGGGETTDTKIVVAERDQIGSVGGAQCQPLNYRYQNCIDSYDEDDELVYQDSDFEDEIELDDEVDSLDDLDDENEIGFDDSKREEQAPLMHLMDNPVHERTTLESSENARYRSKYIHYVLTPVENIVQWKMMKAKEVPPSRQKLEENVERENGLPLSSGLNSKCSKVTSMDVMVNSSLSSWLTLPPTDSNSAASLLRTI
ncbi:hypothetical protein CDL15_Pgr011982 [Punica granatum]|uniref:Uncharacterized protein n=1 Tax=Punica granatum TaxID=22663 RepID=A0A218WCX2_PUNGR|nr:hypothetical protein CDL15_Pgr011982 [Punica granatum]